MVFIKYLVKFALLMTLMLTLTGCEGGDDDDFLLFNVWNLLPLALPFAAALICKTFPQAQPGPSRV